MLSPDIEREQNRPLNPPNDAAENPYRDLRPASILPPDHWYYKLKRTCILGLSIWGLHELRVWHAVMRSPDVNHEWFKAGVASSVGA